jgi:hypothetical protein
MISISYLRLAEFGFFEFFNQISENHKSRCHHPGIILPAGIP